jgi:exoribonuclease R
MRLPSFLIPYEIKNMGFSKVFKNIYVTFSFDKWDDKHPIGRLDNVIGSVDVLDNFYEYQLFCKSLNASIQKFQKDTSKALESRSNENVFDIIKTKYPSIQDRSDQKFWHIITIDPLKSQDFDDGFSIIECDNGIQQLSIYISNVTIWMDVLNLWHSFSRRISTIYLPDKKRPMLPTILSDCLCSLQENVTRIAFVMDIFIKDNEIIDIIFANAFIKVYKNYTYEESKLLSDSKYHLILEATKNLSHKNKYITNVRNSHEMVCYLMILMNYHCAKKLINYKTGIFRSTIMKKDFMVPDTIPEDVGKFIKIWNSASGQYINGAEIKDTRHDILEMEAYIHITSPIRRLVDLLNIIKFQQVTGIIQLSSNVDVFYNHWLGDLEYINITMRSIRKVQCDCSLLDLCNNNPDVMSKEYDGYLFDKLNRNDGLYQYIVFLPDLKLSSRVTMRENYENFTCKKFKLFLFNDEEKFKRKIRLNIV